jgi:hypothetical protein
MEFITILKENEFQNPQIFQQTISLFLEQTTLHQAHLYLLQSTNNLWEYQKVVNMIQTANGRRFCHFCCDLPFPYCAADRSGF